MKGGDIVMKNYLLVIFDEDHNVKENLFFDDLEKLEEKVFSCSKTLKVNDFDIYSLLRNDDLLDFAMIALKRLKSKLEK